MKKTVLIVEDEKLMRDILKDYFEIEGYNVIEAENGIDALQQYEEHNVDLIILDIMMPMLDGYSVCRKIREKSDVLIIIITARGEDDDQLLGFDLGADEYVVKPFSPKVLVARARQLLKRISTVTPISDLVIKDKIEINKGAYSVKVNNQLLDLAPKEFDILLYLIENEGYVLTREKLLDQVWGYDFFGDTRVVDTHIKKLRKKLEDQAKHIHTVIRVGYKFEVIMDEA
ncbi:response regulator transcription factor [Vallitalea okinawensis]|uniref:response regulator transcription factor n=1 Tax=Vallitalea okinawensis TaxID=2078660 RepID=UPI000CFC1BD1|nr:response regulator transcription factor [Vallitalea okinawensis]